MVKSTSDPSGHLRQREGRIEIIDGFRCIAVLGVILSHFYFRFAPPKFATNYYPYPPIVQFEYGGLGVQFFFIISGFVIFMSLQKANGTIDFLKRRFIRLFPCLLLCSVLTYAAVEILDHARQFPAVHPSSGALCFLPSLTIIFPDLWNMLLHRSDIGYVDGAYWSLNVEIQFYFLVSIVYFSFNRQSFLKNWLTLTLALQLLRIVSSPRLAFLFDESLNMVFSNVYAICLKFGFSYYIYFSAGIWFYTRYINNNVTSYEKVIMAALVIMEIYFLPDWPSRFIVLAFMLLFHVFLTSPRYLSVLSSKPFVLIGLVSYPLYLIHQNVGVILIDKISDLIPVGKQLLIPVSVILILVLLSKVIYKFYEKPTMSVLRSWLLGKRKGYGQPLKVTMRR